MYHQISSKTKTCPVFQIKYDENYMEKMKLPTSVKHLPNTNGQLHPSNGLRSKPHPAAVQTKSHTTLFIDNNNLQNFKSRDSYMNGSFVA